MDVPPNVPTPDWGTLGPGSDIKLPPELQTGAAPQEPGARPRPLPSPARLKRIVLVVAATGTVGMFFAQYMTYNALRADREARSPGAARNTRVVRPATPKFDTPAQREAERLLERATANDGAAISQIEAGAAAWRGHIALTPQLTNLITAGLNAGDLRVRAAAIQLDLAAMNVSEDAAAVDRLVRQADSTDHTARIWAIWTLGLLANRGVEPARITDLLISHLADSDLDSRHWAVEGLSYIGSDATIAPLLRTLHDDPSPAIRERAACALAESGMLTKEQRRTAIPTLLADAEDSSLDAETHHWTYHALRDITAQNLPDDAATWRNRYGNDHR